LNIAKHQAVDPEGACHQVSTKTLVAAEFSDRCRVTPVMGQQAHRFSDQCYLLAQGKRKITVDLEARIEEVICPENQQAAIVIVIQEQQCTTDQQRHEQHQAANQVKHPPEPVHTNYFLLYFN
jgi:hypothetical protein